MLYILHTECMDSKLWIWKLHVYAHLPPVHYQFPGETDYIHSSGRRAFDTCLFQSAEPLQSYHHINLFPGVCERNSLQIHAKILLLQTESQFLLHLYSFFTSIAIFFVSAYIFSCNNYLLFLRLIYNINS